MPRVELSNDEYEAVLKIREAEEKPTGYCEDYPCCGHTPDDPCLRQWYDHPDAFNPQVNPHCFCEHEFGICDVYEYEDEVDPEDCEHGDASHRGLRWECDACGSRLKMVTDVSPYVYESKVVPGTLFEISVLGWHFEVL
jgi:hypothetical protein